MQAIRRHKGRFATFSLASASGGVLEAASLVIVTAIAASIADGSTELELPVLGEQSIAIAATLGIAVVAARGFAAALVSHTASWINSESIRSERSELSELYVTAGWIDQEQLGPSQLQERLTRFTQEHGTVVGGVLQIINSSIVLTALVVGALVANPIAAAAIIVFGLGLVLVLRPMRSRVSRLSAAAASSGAKLAASGAEFSAVKLEASIYGVRSRVLARIRFAVDEAAVTWRKAAFARALIPSIYTSLGIAALLISLLVVSRFEASRTPAAAAAILLILRSISYGQSAQSGLASVHAGLPYVHEIEQLKRQFRPQVQLPVNHTDSPIGFQARNLSFSYPGSSDVLRSVSFNIVPGATVGIIGPSGSGKSTLVRLMLGVLEPSAGELHATIEGSDSVRSSMIVGAVPFVAQTPVFLEGSILENVCFLRPAIDSELARSALRSVGLDQEIAGLANGEDTTIKVTGEPLSGGQQQRLSIARAIAARPGALVLDEPTSSLDVRSEKIIRETLERLKGRSTIVIVAHRLSTLDFCDQIMVIQDGELKGFDTPENLEKTSDFYREALILSGMR